MSRSDPPPDRRAGPAPEVSPVGVGHYAGEWTAAERAVVERALRECAPTAGAASDEGPSRPASETEASPSNGGAGGDVRPQWVCLRLQTGAGPHFVAYAYPHGRLVQAETAARLAKALCEDGEDPPEPPRGGIPAYRLRRVLDLVRSEYDDALSVADLARRARMSEGHFAREFKRTLGLTPAAYVMQVRVEEAARLLTTTDDPIGEVASLVGFATASHFAARFREWAGMTPSEFRFRYSD